MALRISSGLDPDTGGTRGHVVEGGPQTVDVGATVQLGHFSARLLRRHVGGRAQHRARLGDILVPLPGQAEIHDEGAEGSVLRPLHHEVRGLEIPVDDADPVGFLDAPRGIPQDDHLLLQGESRGRHIQRISCDALHGDEDFALDLPDLEDLADVFVIHLRLGPGLHHEPLEVVFVVDPDELDGHLAAQTLVPAQEDHAHSALPQEAQEFVPVPVLHRELRNLPRTGSHSGDLGGLTLAGSRKGLRPGQLRIPGGILPVLHDLNSPSSCGLANSYFYDGGRIRSLAVAGRCFRPRANWMLRRPALAAGATKMRTPARDGL